MMHDSAMHKDLSFGRYLKACREDRGMSLEQIEALTKIQQQILSAIEGEEIEALPEDVFVKGFLRAYASVLGVNGADVVRRYMEYKRKIFPKKVEIAASVHDFSYNRNLVMFLVGFVVMVLLVLFLKR
jgi:cytoskeletal protein RodZ